MQNSTGTKKKRPPKIGAIRERIDLSSPSSTDQSRPLFCHDRVITRTGLKMLPRVPWHMSCQLITLAVGAFHSGQFASAPMMGPDQMRWIVRKFRRGLDGVNAVFFFQREVRGYISRKLAALA